MLLEMEETSIDLPEDCWAMVFDHVSDWESLSLVCKRFLWITDNIRDRLSVSNPSNHVLCKLLQRYPNVREIRLINFPGDLNKAILTISKSGLNIEELDLSDNKNVPTVCLEEVGSSMKNLKVLNCSYSNLTDCDLVRIANSFPQLEELQITHSSFHDIYGKIISVTDEGIEYLSSKLKRLRKIDFSGHRRISDKSLIYLSSNCKFLEQIYIGYSDGVTEKGISFVIQNTHLLNSLSLSGDFKTGSFGVGSSTNFPKNLRSLSFSGMDISDGFLYSFAKACIPMREFSLQDCTGYTIVGLSSIINSFQFLKSLYLTNIEFLTDKDIENFTRFLHNLTSIWLDSCPNLSDSAFVMLTQRCHLLSLITMRKTSIGREEYNYDGLRENLAIKYLTLSANQYLSTSFFRRVLQICPNVEDLSLDNCFQRDQKLDVADILDYGRGIKSLTLYGSGKLEFSRKDIEISKLQDLTASRSEIDDEVLTMIGWKCPRLLYLNLQHCKNVTEKGVEEIVKTSERLRSLNLRGCYNVTFDIIEWIVSTRPSLRRLVAPPYLEEEDHKYTWIPHTTPSFYLDEEEEEYLLLHGCLVFRDLRPRMD